MRSQFEPELEVNNGVVKAAGIFDWDDEEERAVVEVTISQRDTKAFGSKKTAKAIPNSEDPQKWELGGVESTPELQDFHPGPATATGIVCALGSQIQMRQFIWTQDVVLKP